nr:PAS domain S-box protein [Bacteroidota bacterium]
MKKNAPDNSKTLYFLQGAGEMRERIREYDWASTPLGTPELWPTTLKTAVSIMLDNPFAMYIAWGKEYIQLYNDGYRPILGENKHPKALGISSRETFMEIWHIIGSMFDSVMEGEAVAYPHFMLLLNRNGYMEECFFDFAYSPIRLEDGTVGGVLVTVTETTTKKKAEDALKKSEQYFRAMADNIPNLAWMADETGYIFWYNKQWYDYTGTTVEQMKGWGWQSVHDPDWLPTVITNWTRSLENGEPFEMTFPLKGADGLYRKFLTRVLPVRDKDGRIYQWFGTNTDITTQIQAEQNLKESEQRFRAVADNIPNLAWMADETGYIFWYNKQWYEYTGTTVEQMKGWGWQSVHDPDMLPKVITKWTRSLENGEPFEMTFPLKGADGLYRKFLTRVLPVRDKDGRIYQWFGTNTDVTNQIEIEQSLIESEERFRTMAEGTDVLIATSDETSNASYFNKAWTNFTGRSMGQLINYG